MRKTFAIALLTMAAWSVPAGAQTMAWVDQAYQRLQYATGWLNNVSTLSSFAYQIRQGETYRIYATPTTNGYVQVAGSCDEDCNNIAIRVYDSSGYQMHNWSGYGGGYSSTGFYGRANTRYTVEFYPEDCSAAFCFSLGYVYQQN